MKVIDEGIYAGKYSYKMIKDYDIYLQGCTTQKENLIFVTPFKGSETEQFETQIFHYELGKIYDNCICMYSKMLNFDNREEIQAVFADLAEMFDYYLENLEEHKQKRIKIVLKILAVANGILAVVNVCLLNPFMAILNTIATAFCVAALED